MEHVTFRWNGQALLVTTPTMQHEVSAQSMLTLLAQLYDHRDEIIAALQADDSLLEWARRDAELLARAASKRCVKAFP